MIKYCIYKIQSSSGKVYIGQTKNINNRLLNYKWVGKQTARQPLLHKSLVKYGINNHIIEILETELTKEEADIKEIYYIAEYKRLKLSLNCTDGGSNVSNKLKKPVVQFDLDGIFIQKFISIIDAANSLNIIPQKIQIAIIKKRYYSSGFLWIDETSFIAGIIPIWNSKKSSRKRIIQQFDLNMNLIDEFLGTAEAYEKTNINRQSILNCLNNFSKTANNFIWKYK